MFTFAQQNSSEIHSCCKHPCTCFVLFYLSSYIWPRITVEGYLTVTSNCQFSKAAETICIPTSNTEECQLFHILGNARIVSLWFRPFWPGSDGARVTLPDEWQLPAPSPIHTDLLGIFFCKQPAHFFAYFKNWIVCLFLFDL